jgi:protein-S-isoprenylcysteine O-methyltransferase Ste14
MALIEEFDESGNWLFNRRSYLPLILYVLAVLVIWLDGDEMFLYSNLAWGFSCYLVSMIGQIIRALVIGYVPKATSGRNTDGQVAETLNIKGIYATVRHPLYLGNFFMWLGVVLYVGNFWFVIVCCLLFWIYYERIMFAEEHFLRKKFQEVYLRWSDYTPAFWPRWEQWTSPQLKFSWKNVLKREYNGFFAVGVSFLFISILKNYFYKTDFSMSYEWFIKNFYVPNFIIYIFIVSAFIFLALRSLKKYTRLLDVTGR